MAIHLAKFKYFTKRVSPSNHWLKQSEDSDMFWLCFDASPPSLSMNSTTDISFKKGRLVGDNSQFLDFWDDVRCHYTSPRKMVFHNTMFPNSSTTCGDFGVFFYGALNNLNEKKQRRKIRWNPKKITSRVSFSWHILGPCIKAEVHGDSSYQPFTCWHSSSPFPDRGH